MTRPAAPLLAALEARRRAQLRGLAEASVALRSSPSLDALLHLVARQARELVGARQAVLSYTRGEDWSQSVTAVSLSPEYAAWQHYAEVPDGSGIYAQVCRTNRPMRLRQAELEAHPLWRGFGPHAADHPPLRGWLAAPLVARDGRNLGVLQLSDKAPGPELLEAQRAAGVVDPEEFDEGDEVIAVQLAQLVAVAVEDAAARDALAAGEARYRSLVQAMANDVWTATPDGRLLDDMPSFRAVTGQSAADLLGDGWLRGVHPDDRPRVAAAWQRAVASREAYSCEYRVVPAAGRRAEDARTLSVRGVPIERGGEVVEWVGVTVDVTDARRTEAEREERGRLNAVLAEASVALTTSLERDEVVDRLAGLLVPTLGDWAVVHLVERGETRLRLAAVAHGDPLGREEVRRQVGLLRLDTAQPTGPGAVVREGRPQQLTVDRQVVALGRGEPQRAVLSGFSGGTVAVVPLTARDRTAGALTLARGDRRPLTRTELDFVADLGRRAALALENAALYAAQRDVAVTLQRSLLPQRMPEVADLRFAAAYRPAGAGAEIGGDWYDALELPGGRVGLAVGDVMGRGVRAAAVMGQLRAALRGYALEDHPPSEVLRRLDVVVQAFDDLQLTTCVYAVYDPATRALQVASAGHLPPLLLAPGVPPRYLEVEPGLPLGVGGSAFVQQEVVLPAGTAVVLYTDGLVESREVLVDAGLEQLLEVVRDVDPADPRAVHERALAGMGRDTTHDDDVAVLVVHTGGTAPAGTAHARTLELELSPSPAAARSARVAVSTALAEWGLLAAAGQGEGAASEAVDTVLLLVSELVTNAVVHAGTPLRLLLRVEGSTLTASVTDESSDLPPPPDLSRLADAGDGAAVAEGGRGLPLVALLADTWSVDTLPHGKCVSFTVALGDPYPGSSSSDAGSAR